MWSEFHFFSTNRTRTVLGENLELGGEKPEELLQSVLKQIESHLVPEKLINLEVLKCGAGEGWRRSVGPIV